MAMDPLTMLALEVDPSQLLDLLGFDPLGWQRHLLRSTSDKVMLNCHRQAGKSCAAGALAIWTALRQPGSLTIVVSASQRQANELLRKIVGFYKALGTPVGLVEDSSTTLSLATGSRVVSLPDSIDTIVGFSSPRLIILDEASRMKDETYLGVRPMLTRSRGRMVLMSTPRGRRGFYYMCWNDHDTTWDRVEFPVTSNPHIDPDWLEEERRLLGPRWFAQEYSCSFEETEGQYFPTEAVLAAFSSSRPPLITGSEL